MLKKLFQKILSWLRELWSLLKLIDEAVSKERDTTSNNTYSAKPKSNRARRNALHQYDGDEPSVVRHRYIELDGYAESLRIDERGRYDLNQISRFAENFVWIDANAIDEFIDSGIEYDTEYTDGSDVLWVDKDECIEWVYMQHSAIADLL